MDNKSKKAVILAAGKGTRMKSQYPKVLHKIMGISLLDRVLNTLDKLNIDERFVVLGHQSELVKEEIAKLNINRTTCVLQEPQLGTGHAVFQVYGHLSNHKGTVLILCGDTPLLTTETLEQFIQNHEATESTLSILSAQASDPTNYGRIVRGLEGTVRKIVEEKDATSEERRIKEINTGVYCLEWEKIAPAFSEISSNNAQGEYYLTDIVEWATNKELNVNAFMIASEEEMYGINSKSDLAVAIKLLNQRTIDNLMANGVTIIDPDNTWISPETQIAPDCTVLPGCYIEGSNFIGKNSVIGPNVYISGNVNIGENCAVTMSKLSNVSTGNNCQLGPFAHLRDDVKLADNVRIGNFVEVKKSVIDSNTNAAHLSYIGNAELGTEVNIGAGTITANYDPLTRTKSTTILGNKVKIGSNSVLVAPITVEEGANVAAGSVITKNVPGNSLAIARQKQSVIENWVTKKLKEKTLTHS